MEQKRYPIFSIDIRIRFRGAIYQLDVVKLLKWLGAFLVVGLRIYRGLYGASS